MHKIIIIIILVFCYYVLLYTIVFLVWPAIIFWLRSACNALMEIEIRRRRRRHS